MQSRLRLIRPSRRWLVGVFSGGSFAGFVVLHAIHVAAVAAGPFAIQFLCQIPH